MNQRIILILIILYVIETLLCTHFHGYFGIFMSPVVLFCASLGIGVLPLMLQTINYSTTTNQNIIFPLWQKFLFTGLVAAGLISTLNVTKSIVRVTAISLELSDILPLMQQMVKRFVAGEFPYQLVKFSYDIFPTYLPAHWLPFVVSEKLGIDYRISATIVLLICASVFFYQIFKNSLPFYQKIILILACFLPLNGIFLNNAMIIGVSVEQMTLGYYILLLAMIGSRKNLIWKSVAIVLCLLSRFSFLFWLPLYVLSIWQFEGSKKMLRLIGNIFVGVLLLYILPFMSQDWQLFSKAQNVYMNAAIGEWTNNTSHLKDGLGLAIYFYQYIGGTMAQKIHTIQLTNVLLSILTLGILAFVLIKNKQKLEKSKTVFEIASLKIMLTVFYGFIQVPYQYLWVVPMGISVLVLWITFKQCYEVH